jgi:hypothetical protein
MRRALILSILCSCGLPAQTTQGLISGRVLDSNTGRPIPGAQISFWQLATHTSGTVHSSDAGFYSALFLAPGVYRLRVSASGYQPQEVYDLELAVAARLELRFLLRPLSDVWEAGQPHSIFLPRSETVLTFYGPDVDTSRAASFEATKGLRGALESTVSQVIDPFEILELPLAGQDVYTMLVTQPGVTADSGTARSLGLSINGQRPSASNFLLDGLENNDYLVTGPLASIAPEAVQEYRVSTSSFSAEYGRTAGYLANAVTRSGGSEWHGILYANVKNDALNANSFQNNLQGLPRTPLKESQIGYHAGGPIRVKLLFLSSALDHTRTRSYRTSEQIQLPSTTFLEYSAPNSLARKLIQRFPPPAVTSGVLPVANWRGAPPDAVDRSLLLERLDFVSPGGGQHVMGRVAVTRLSRPDFIWTPYKDFVSGLEQNASSIALGHTASVRPDVANEVRFGWTNDDIGWDRAHPEIPTLAALDGTVLPGSPAFYAFRNHTRGIELTENLTLTRDRHIVKVGGGFLARRLDGFLTAGRDGRYLFDNFLKFLVDQPSLFSLSLSRTALPILSVPDFNREYGFRQFDFFGEDVFRWSSRLVLNFGLRYENFGAPQNTGRVKDSVVALDRGKVVFPASGDQPLYRSDNRSWAPRFGFSYDWSGKLVLRGAYGLFYDRPFDNLWQNLRNNNFVLPNFAVQSKNYLAPVREALPSYQNQAFAGDFPSLTFIDPALRNSYSQNYFLGLERQVTESWVIEVNGLGALGRRLITTDQVNRRVGSYFPQLPIVSYRAAQGVSNYHALTVTANYRSRRARFQAAYTWSHSIDLQSEPLAGDFFNLDFTRLSPGEDRQGVAAFARQQDSRSDRGNSDFDQRQNLVFYSIWDLPWHFRFAQLAAIRSGFPYTVFAPATLGIFDNRPDQLFPAQTSKPVEGGRQVLDAAAFTLPSDNRVGDTGRNAFRGPSVYSVDVSLSRTFPVRRLGESGRITIRAGVFNLLNHANLNNPDSVLGSPSFGIALYGRQGRDTGFPGLVPFQETPRQLQLLLRIDF